MIRINLLPVKEAERALGRRQQRSLAMLAVTVALLFTIVPFLVQGRRLASLQDQIDTVQRDVDRYNEQVKEVQDLDKLKAEVEAKLRIIEELEEKRVGPARMLGDLSVATPRNLWLIEFTESGGGARFTGIALDNETVALFMRQLAASPYFFNVDLDESVQVRPTGPAGETALLTRFVVKATVDFFGRGGKPAGDGADKPAGGKPQRGT